MRKTSTAYGKSLKDLDILIVEDNSSMRMLICTILRGFGVPEPRQARDGTSGLIEIQHKAPSLIISDWEMSPMNGGDFLRAVRNVDWEPYCFIPIIVLTAHASRPLIQEAFDCGATQLLVKPITPANLLQRIGWVLEDDRLFEKVGGIYRQEMMLPKGASSRLSDAERRPAPIWSID